MHLLPLDVLLHFLTFLRLQETLTVSSTCKSLFGLRTQRVFWITALENERRWKPIACTQNEDLTKHDLIGLQKIAWHTVRLERNWTSTLPRILGDTRKVSLGLPGLDLIFQIPGTWLYVFHFATTGCVELWDIEPGKRVGEPLKVGKNVWDVSPGEDLPGKFSMGLLVAGDGEPVYRLLVLCVEYGGLGEPTLTATLSINLRSPAEHWAVFLDPEVTGTLCYNYETEKFCITAVNRATACLSLITTDLPNEDVRLALTDMAQSGSSMVNGDLCIIFAETSKSRLFTLPRRYLPTNDNPNCSSDSVIHWGSNFNSFGGLYDLKEEDEEEPESSIRVSVLTANDNYGVPAMSLDRRDTWILNEDGDEQAHRELSVTAWVLNPQEPEGVESKRGPHVVPVHLEDAIPGTLQSLEDADLDNHWLLIIQTLSGRKSLLLSTVAEDQENNLRLRLVHCDPNAKDQENIIFYRDIEVPSFINLSTVHGLFLDDHMGVVSLIDTKGDLYILPMA